MISNPAPEDLVVAEVAASEALAVAALAAAEPVEAGN